MGDLSVVWGLPEWKLGQGQLGGRQREEGLVTYPGSFTKLVRGGNGI